MRYRLRTLLIVLALGPPMLATAWTNREELLHRFDTESSIPAGLTAQAEARMRKQFAINQTLHTIAGVGSVVLYPLAVFLIGAVLSKRRRWMDPPKSSPLGWAAIAVSVLAAILVLMFFLTIPWPEPMEKPSERWIEL